MMSGYRVWIEQRKLLAWLEAEKHKLNGLSESERLRRSAELERDYRVKLDEIYGRIRQEGTPAKA